MTFEFFVDGLWSFLGLPLMLFLGAWFTWHSRFFQLRGLPAAIRYAYSSLQHTTEGAQLHPLKAWLASLGGAVGIGNIASVCVAVKVGGPGAAFWVWVAAFFGAVVKYVEIYLGITFRTKKGNRWCGGPMHYLAFASSYSLPTLAALCLAIYGIEVYQFRVVQETISYNCGISPILVTGGLLIAVFATTQGGMQRIADLCSWLIPLFIVLYFSVALWALYQWADRLPAVFAEIFHNAFTGSAPVGAFAGASFWMAAGQGIARGCYASDIGVGYNALIHSQSSEKQPYRQAQLTLLSVLVDVCGACTLSLLLALTSGGWHTSVDASFLVQEALAQHFSWAPALMTVVITLVGFSTVVAFFGVGEQCAVYLAPAYGKLLFALTAGAAFICFSFIDTGTAQDVMACAGLILLLLNAYAFWFYRAKIKFISVCESDYAS